jgi:hypothetical protein
MSRLPGGPLQDLTNQLAALAACVGSYFVTLIAH